MTVSSLDQLSGDDAVIAATGRPATEWFAILDEVQAVEWPHPRIDLWLAEQHGVPSWWAQNLTVRYEQAIGRRQPGQQADGTFSASRSRSVPRDAGATYRAVVAAASVELGLEPRRRRDDAARPNSRWTLPGGEDVLVAVDPTATGARVAVMFEKLADSAATVEAKERAARILAAGLDASTV
jgi:hypothetical protein